MTKTTKIIIWSVVGLAVIGGSWWGYSAYKKYQTTSKDPEKNDRKIVVNGGIGNQGIGGALQSSDKYKN